MKRTSLIFAALIVVGVSGGLFAEHQLSQKLKAEHESLAQELARLSADHAVALQRAVNNKEAAAAAGAKSDELRRLRDEAALLREKTNEVAMLIKEGWDLRSQLAVLPENISMLPPDDQFILRHTHVDDAAMKISVALKKYEGNHPGEIPSNFDQLTASGCLAETNFYGGLTLDDFEWLPPGVLGPRDQDLMLRNRVRIPKPNGNPIWVYVTRVGGTIDTAEDFTAPGPHTHWPSSVDQ